MLHRWSHHKQPNLEVKAYMPNYPISPRVMKGAILIMDPQTLVTRQAVMLQYNPDSVTRSLKPQALGGDGDRLQPLRLLGAPVQTLNLDAEIDATDQLEAAEPNALLYGIEPQLSALETLVYPASADVMTAAALANQGTMEIAPLEAPLTLFAWNESRVLPVRITEFNIVEEAFDPQLHPIRAKVTLGMRVLGVNDLGHDHPGGNLFMTYHRQREALAQLAKS